MIADIIDGYCHCGLRKFRPIEDLTRVMQRFEVNRAVLVQHMGNYDNGYIEQIVRAEPDRFAGVFLVDAEADDAAESLAHWAGKGVFRGIRLLAHTLETCPDLWEQAAAHTLNIMLYEEPSVADYVDPLAGFLRSHPEARAILAHFGRLIPSESPRFESFDRILSLAEFPNAFIQVSGMDAFASYPFNDLAPLVRRALGAFGPERTLYGSNYPASRSEAAYGQDLALLMEGRLGVPAECLAQVLSRTARALWFAHQTRQGEKP